MTLVRRHLRLLAAAWIVFQATSLSALVPRACCLAHDAALMSKTVDCHEEILSPHCTMSGMEEAPGAMHHMHGTTPHHAMQHSQKPSQDCAIRGTCGGPLAAIFAIFATHAVLPDRTESAASLTGTSAALAAAEDPIGQFVPPDAPPPRA
jgi:hypothetical protein